MKVRHVMALRWAAKLVLIIILLIWTGRASVAFDTPTNSDIRCAIVSGAEMSSLPKDSPEQESATQIYLFYLGRLYGRDERVSWKDILLGRMAELREKARQPTEYLACMGFVAAKMR